MIKDSFNKKFAEMEEAGRYVPAAVIELLLHIVGAIDEASGDKPKAEAKSNEAPTPAAPLAKPVEPIPPAAPAAVAPVAVAPPSNA